MQSSFCLCFLFWHLAPLWLTRPPYGFRWEVWRSSECDVNSTEFLFWPVYLWTKNIYVRYSYRTCKGFDLPMNLVTDGGSIDVYCLVHHGSSIAMLGNAFSKPWSVSPLENASSVFIALYFLIRALEDNSYIRFKIFLSRSPFEIILVSSRSEWSICLCT